MDSPGSACKGETGPPDTLSKQEGPGGSGIPAPGEREGTMELKGKHVAVLAEDLYQALTEAEK